MAGRHQPRASTPEVRISALFIVCVVYVHVAIVGCGGPETYKQGNAVQSTGAAGGGGAAGSDSAGASGQIDAAGVAGTGPDASGTAGASAGSGLAGLSGLAGSGMDAGAVSSDANGRLDTVAPSDGAGGSGGSGGQAGAAGGGASGTTGGIDHCNHKNWTATASVTGGDGGGPPAGIDGDLTTRWASNRFQDGTDWYAVDFGGAVRLTKIVLDNTQTYPDDYPGAYAVYGSSDGVTFDTTPFVTGNGAEDSTTINFTQRMVRAVRIQQTGTSRQTNWWQIGEFETTCSQ